MPRPNEQTYRPGGYGMSPALLRARSPFRWPNAITGIALFGFAVAVWAYSISAVKQEDFGDIDAMVPQTEDRVKTKSIAEELKAHEELGTLASTAQRAPSIDPPGSTGATSIATPTSPSPPPAAPGSSSRGFASKILPRLQLESSLVDSASSTLIWGAPNVDRVGALSDRSSSPGERRRV